MANLARVGEALYNGFKAAGEQYVQQLSRSGQVPGLNLAGDLWGFGYQGGPLEGGLVREIILHKGKVQGFRNYDEDDPGARPMEYTTDLQKQGNMYINCGGVAVDLEKLRFDDDFERWGSASRLTNEDYLKVEDKTSLLKEMLQDGLSWYVGKGGVRKELKDPVTGVPHPDYTVVEIPRAKHGLFEKFDPKGFDPGTSLYFALQSIVYKLFDDVLFEPLVEGPIRRINEGLEKRNLPGIRMDAFVTSEYTAVSEIVNALFDLPSPNELYS